MPPSKSGIADYSDALLPHLREFAAVDVNSGDGLPLYQIGNNHWHEAAYREALRRPGVVVLHEANLHHLIAEITIKQGDWDGYVEACAYDGGPAARAWAERVRALETGPDYEGVPMLRRLLESARGVIVHSRYMAEELRRAGYRGPAAVIPHGAWIPEAAPMLWRERLGLDESTPLIGTFGHLKPYKRIAEALRAFKRLVRVQPEARMILVGEPHPDFPVQEMIRSLGIAAHARVIGFAPIEDFVGYMAACDIVLNLRFPTVGESSGSLLRALGLGKAVLVSDLGSFAEFPDSVCLKVPVGPGEEDVLFEYLNLLVSRPEVARKIGTNARCWVETECNWRSVARRYVEFLRAVEQGTAEPLADVPEALAADPEHEPPSPDSAPPYALPDAPVEPELPPFHDAPAPAPELAEYVAGWAESPAAAQYLETHKTRLARTLEITPAGGPDQRVLEMGAYLQITPALKTQLGYGEVRGCYFGKLGERDHRSVASQTGETFECVIDHFDAEKDPYPYPDAHFDTVLCCELIEHLFEDPMHLMSEVNRILVPGGTFVLTTPNIASMRALSAILQGYHPGFFHAYIRPNTEGEADARHNREYTPREIHLLLENAGFEVALLETGPFRDEPHPEFHWVRHLLDRYRLPTHLRGDGIYAAGRKTGPVRERYPGWLYS